jgi:hypothetical protein
MADRQEKLNLARMLVARLERMPADSYWAHQASGLRGSLLRLLERQRRGYPVDGRQLGSLVERGFEILENAAKEI